MTDMDLRAELRDYYSSVASERPVDGQLERVIAATALINPRRRWQTEFAAATQVLHRPMLGGLRLATWLALLLLILAGLALGFGIASRPAAPPPDFEGIWRTRDLVDRSPMVLVVGASDTPLVRFEDDYATGCANAEDDNTHFISIGQGEVKGDRLTVTYPEGGGCTTHRVDPYVDVFLMDSATGEITDTYGNVWHGP